MMAVFSSVADGGCEPSYFRLMCVGKLESEECDWDSDCDCRCDGATTGDGLVVLSMTNDELLGGMGDIYYGTLLRLLRHRQAFCFRLEFAFYRDVLSLAKRWTDRQYRQKTDVRSNPERLYQGGQSEKSQKKRLLLLILLCSGIGTVVFLMAQFLMRQAGYTGFVLF